jgi:hypothetical protein
MAAQMQPVPGMVNSQLPGAAKFHSPQLESALFREKSRLSSVNQSFSKRVEF